MAASMRRERMEKMKKIRSKLAKKKHRAVYKRSSQVIEGTKDIVKADISPKLALDPLKVIGDLLSPISLSNFFDTYWEKKPLILHRKGTSHFNNLFGVEDFFNLLSSQVVLKYKEHVNFCRYVDGKRINEHESGRVKLNEAKQLWNKVGATIQFHQPQHFKDSIWQLLTQLETVFGCLVGANVYMTPPNSQGLAPHYDDVEVIIIQLEGRKHWRLYVPPMSLPQDYSRDFSQDEIGSPTHDFTLESGDLLYFPRGTIHQADTPADTHSTHITISTYQHHAWTNFLYSLLPILLKEASNLQPLFRQGLPLNMIQLTNGIMKQSTNDGGIPKMCCQLVSELVSSINEGTILQAQENHSLDFISSRLPPFYQNKDEIGPKGCVPQCTDRVTLCWPDYTYLHHHSTAMTDDKRNSHEEEEDCVFVFHSLTNSRSSHMVLAQDSVKPAGLRFPRHYEPAIGKLFSSQGGDGVEVNSLPLEINERTQLIMSLWAEGLIAVCH